MALDTPCDFAKLRYVEINRFRNLWGVLWIVLGASIALFLIAAILLFLRSSWLPGALTVLGTIVNGAGLTWVTSQRNAAVGEERAAFDDLARLCSNPEHAAIVQSLAPGSSPPAEIGNAAWYREVSNATQSARAAREYIAHIRK